MLTAIQSAISKHCKAIECRRWVYFAGPGVLGSHLGSIWLDFFPGSQVVGQTNSETNHDR